MTVRDCPVTDSKLKKKSTMVASLQVKVATPAASLMKNCWLEMSLKTQKKTPTK
jgi:hypothetical protein